MKSLLRPPLAFNTAARMYDYLMKLSGLGCSETELPCRDYSASPSWSRRDIASIWDTPEGPVHLGNSRGPVEDFAYRITFQTPFLPRSPSPSLRQVRS